MPWYLIKLFSSVHQLVNITTGQEIEDTKLGVRQSATSGEILAQLLSSWTMEINDLPDEVLGLIFSHFDLRTRVVCELTCQRWNIVMRSVLLPTIRLCATHPIDKHNLYDYPRMVTEVGEVESHEMDVCKVNPLLVKSFLNKHKRGKALYLRVNEQSTLQLCLKTVERKWFNLRTLQLDVRGWFRPDLSSITKSRIARYITRMAFGHEFQGSSSLLDQFYASCPNLKMVVLGQAGADHLPYLTALSHLRTLFIASPMCFKNRSRDVRWMTENLSNLQELKVHSIDGEEFTMICNMLNLVTFGCKFRCGQPMDSLLALGQLKNLRNFSFSCSEPDVYVTLLQALSNCANLKTLSLNVCLSQEMVASLPSCVQKLEALELSRHMWSESCYHAMRALPELARMAHLKTLRTPSTDTPLLPLIRLIERSSSLRNIDGIDFARDWHMVRLFNAMNRKAMVTKNEQFALRIRIARERLSNVAPNLKVYCFS